MSDDWVRPKPHPLGCYDCGFEYGGPGWCDAVVSNEVWLQISPTGHEGGILCINCMGSRIEKLSLSNVPLKITSGPWVVDTSESQAKIRQKILYDLITAVNEGAVATVISFRDSLMKDPS